MSQKIKVIIAMLIYGSLGVFVTQLSLPTSQIVFVRAAIACLALFLILLVSGKLKTKVPFASFALLLFLGGLIGINWLLLFDAYKYTYVSTATLIYYLQPVFVIILSTLLLKEKLTKRKIIGVLLAIVGMLLINGLQLGGADPKRGFILSLAAAVLYSIIVFINKANKSIGKLDGLLLTDIQMFGAAIVMGFYTFANYGGEFAHLDKKSIIILIILGVVHTALAYYLYFSSIKHIDGQSLAVLGYIDPASALFFSAFLLNEKLSILQWVGAVLILGGALYSQIKAEK